MGFNAFHMCKRRNRGGRVEERNRTAGKFGGGGGGGERKWVGSWIDGKCSVVLALI